jgi:hypothetical protein
VDGRNIFLPNLKAIYRTDTAETDLRQMEAFEECWGRRHPVIDLIVTNLSRG